MGFGFLKKKKKKTTSGNILNISEDVMDMNLDGSK